MTSKSHFVFVALAALPVVLAGTVKTCTNPQLSCQNTTAVSDLCCFNAPGGQLLQTQFWDTNPSTGTSCDIIFSSHFFSVTDNFQAPPTPGQSMASGLTTVMVLTTQTATLIASTRISLKFSSHSERLTFFRI